MLINSSQQEGGEGGVWLRVRMWNALVLNLRTTVRATRDSLRELDQTLCARRRITGSVGTTVCLAQRCSRRTSIASVCVKRRCYRQCRGRVRTDAVHSGQIGFPVSSDPDSATHLLFLFRAVEASLQSPCQRPASVQRTAAVEKWPRFLV